MKIGKFAKQYWRKWKNLSLGAKIFLSVFFLFFLAQAIVQMYPFLWVINNSLKTLEEFGENSTFALTTTWQFVNYVKVFDEFVVNGTVGYWTLVYNSAWQTFLYLFVNIMSSLFVAYALAKFRFPGRGLLYGFMIFIQTIPIVGVGAAAYKLRYTLGMIDNPATIWLCWAVGFDYSAFILYGTLQGVSKSYMESAEIDGANELTILFKVVFPLIFPSVLALMVTNFVGVWNNYSTSQIDLPNYPSLAYGMYLFQAGSTWSESGKVVYYASLIMSAIPGILIYACFQNLIIKNISVGGLKG